MQRGLPLMPADVVLQHLFDVAVATALPGDRMAALLPPPPPPPGRTIVIGAGKAAAAMAGIVEAAWPVDRAGGLTGLVVTRCGHGVPTRHIEVVEAAPAGAEDAGVSAAERILRIAETAGEGDQVICLLSGGGAELLSLPAAGLSLADKAGVTRALARSGATVGEIACVRKHLSGINGGRLAAAAAPASVCTFVISDVVGDDPTVIASGPTVADPTTHADATAVLRRYAIPVPAAVAAHLASANEETPKPGDPRLARNCLTLITTASESLTAAAAAANALGCQALVLADGIEGEAREVGRVLAAMAAYFARRSEPMQPPFVLLSGGETTATVCGNGRGGPNGEFLLSMLVALAGHPQIWAIACSTDGIDGTGTNAGAILRPSSYASARTLGFDLAGRLADNDSYSVFSALGDLVVTGPTRTDVNDFRAILVTGGSA